MRYIPQTKEDIDIMLKEIGVSSIDDLFTNIPKRLKEKLNLPSPLDEQSLLTEMKNLAKLNGSTENLTYFIGGGSYFHFIPEVVYSLVSRSEFYTAYTPYQPEISQGTLQAIFEFQTYISLLTGMDVANASMYDGASSLAEAILMSFRIKKKSKVIVSEAVNPDYLKVVQTYLSGRGEEIKIVPFNRKSGKTDISKLEEFLNDDIASVVIQYPNFFGIVEDLDEIEKLVHSKNILLISSFTEPFAFGILKPPGEFNADIVSGEAQSFGMPPSFGGPYLGVLASKEKYLRTMPGRIVGQTTDHNGKRAYVLTLSAREQHIRREKATSNICSNEGLCALIATIYLTTLGRKGFQNISEQNHLKSELTKKQLSEVDYINIKFDTNTFNEFVIELKKGKVEDFLNHLIKEDIIAGIPLKKWYPDLENSILLTVTDFNRESDIERLIDAIKKYSKN